MKIKLKKKKLKTGKYSLYIEYYKGFIQNDKGKIEHNREFEYLKEYLIIEPKTTKERKKMLRYSVESRTGAIHPQG